MNQEEENAIVNEHAEAVMKQLAAGGKPVEAVITVVMFKGGENYSVGSMIDTNPESDEEADRLEGGALMTASDLLVDYVHERGLCVDCNEKERGVH